MICLKGEGFYMASTLFDSFWEEEKKENILNGYAKNTPIKKTVIPTFEVMFNEKNGFGIYVVEDTDENEFSIKGNFIAPLVLGQTYFIDGYISHYKGENQISVNTYYNVKPVNKKGIIAYLQTLKGLKTKAEWIYNVFGDESIEVLMKNPEEVARKVKGIGKKSVLSWSKQLEKLKDSQVFISTLLGYGLTPNQANKLYKKYGEEIVQRIEENPYFLSKEVRGYGFERCDRIARRIGFSPKSPFRIQEGIIHVLTKATNEGHCYLPTKELIERTKDLLTIRLQDVEMKQLLVENFGAKVISYRIGEDIYEIPYQDLQESYERFKIERNLKKKDQYRYQIVSFEDDDFEKPLQELNDGSRIVCEDKRVYLLEYYEAEVEVANKVKAIANTKIPFSNPLDMKKELNEYCKKNGYELEKKQYEAVISFTQTRGNFHILNGSAGCGKTFTLKIILEMLERQFKANRKRCRVLLLAPTGKASKVASKSTGRGCVTVHRGLAYHPALGFQFNEDNPLDYDVIVVDESSMMDILLMNHLMKAVKEGTKVIFIGDTKQLPSVGAGNVLKDLIDSNFVEVVTLDVVKRQGKLSGIIKNANRIIHQKMIQSEMETRDSFVLLRQSAESVNATLIESMKRILKFPGYTIEDVQVLVPQRTGSVGTYALNYLIQQTFNAHNNSGKRVFKLKFEATLNSKVGRETFELYLQKGDKVIHINNDYDMAWYDRNEYGEYIKDESTLGITNGECGIIEDIIETKIDDEKVTRIIVRYEDKYVFYDDNFDSLEHAWALTIHKSQGSQWKATITPIVKQHFTMLDNNLFYTGKTRAEEFDCTIGQVEALYHAIMTKKMIQRYTGLKERLLA